MCVSPSSFFAQDIVVTRIYAHTGPRDGPASPSNPITQERRVHLLAGASRKLACIATSTVTITSPEAERLFLDEHYAIGQCYRALRRSPKFTLHTIDVRKNASNDRRELARTYTLEIEGLKCDIEEVFPDRDMFDLCEDWFLPESERPAKSSDTPAVNHQVAVRSPVDVFRALLSLILRRRPVLVECIS
jgi:hypothetical protein